MERNDLIYMYMNSSKLDIEKVMLDYTGYIYTIVKNAGNFSKEDIEEIVSDVFFALWNNQEKLDINRKMSIYLWGITKNIIKKKFRNIKINDNIEDFEENLISKEDIIISSSRDEINTIIINELNKMKSEDEEIFIKFYYYSKKIKEISIELNITEAKVKTKLHRIRKKIKERLEKGGYGYYG